MNPIIITEAQHRIIDHVLQARDEATRQGKHITECHLGIEQARAFDAGPTGDHQIVIAGIPCRITNHKDFIGYAMEPIPPMRFRFESTNTGRDNRELFRNWMDARPTEPALNIEAHQRILLDRIAAEEKERMAKEQPTPTCATCRHFHRNPPTDSPPFVCTNPASPSATTRPDFTCDHHHP